MNTAVSVIILLASAHADASPSAFSCLGKCGHERLRQRAFRKQIAQQVGHPERQIEAIHPPAAAKQRGEHHFPQQSQHPARHHGGADFPCGFGGHQT